MAGYLAPPSMSGLTSARHLRWQPCPCWGIVLLSSGTGTNAAATNAWFGETAAARGAECSRSGDLARHRGQSAASLLWPRDLADVGRPVHARRPGRAIARGASQTSLAEESRRAPQAENGRGAPVPPPAVVQIGPPQAPVERGARGERRAQAAPV